MSRTVGKIWRDQAGTAAIEFSIIGLVLTSLCIATVDFGRTLYVKNQLSLLADEAARKVLLNPAVTDTQLENELRGDFDAGDPNDLKVTLSTETIGSSNFRVLDIDFPITLFIPSLASATLNLNVSRRVPEG